MPFCGQLQLVDASRAQRPEKTKRQGKTECGTMYKTRRVFATNGYLCTSAKIKFRMKSYECSENCARQQTRRKDKDDPKRVASKAQLPLSSDALNGRATGLMPVPGVDLRISNYDIRACHPSDPCTAVVEGEWRDDCTGCRPRSPA